MDRAIHAGPDEALLEQVFKEVFVFSLLLADEGRKDMELRSWGQLQDAVQDFIPRLGGDDAVALGTMPLANAGEEDTEIIVDFGNRADGRPRVVSRRFL